MVLGRWGGLAVLVVLVVREVVGEEGDGGGGELRGESVLFGVGELEEVMVVWGFGRECLEVCELGVYGGKVGDEVGQRGEKAELGGLLRMEINGSGLQGVEVGEEGVGEGGEASGEGLEVVSGKKGKRGGGAAGDATKGGWKGAEGAKHEGRF